MLKMPPMYSFAPTKQIMAKMKDFYAPFQQEAPSPYVDLFARGEGFTLTLYKPAKNGEAKAVFQGINAVEEARLWDQNAVNLAKQPVLPRSNGLKPPLTIRNVYPQIGSDEVGTGDFFGPICVCAAYVDQTTLPRVQELEITDSKKMEDAYILEIGPLLIKEFPYSQLSLTNEKYNAIHDDFNMNAIKAKMHNRCDLNLLDKYPNSAVYQDQFAEPRLYFSYLKGEQKVVRDIFFHTKGESLFPSVALASVIARYSFLRKMQDLSEKYHTVIPFGAGEEVDAFASSFLKEFGREELDKIVKKSFANYRKLI